MEVRAALLPSMDKPTVILIVCFVYFLILIVTGVTVSRRNRKTSDFLIAGRKLNLVFTVATLSAVQIGAGVILGGSANGARSGVWPGMWYALGCGGGLILGGLLVAGKLRQKESYVPLDFYESRYGASKWVRIWAWLSNVPSLLGIFIAQILACGSILSGLGVPFTTGIIICAIIILIYSTIGGMWGIVFTDVIQTSVIIISLPLVAISAALLMHSKGIQIGSVYSTPFIPHGMLVRFIYLVIPFLIAISVSYDAYIRYQSARDARTASLGCIIAGVVVIFIGILTSTVGAISAIIFPEIKEGVFSHMVMQVMNPVVAGIVTAAILGASMSSASGLLIALGATFSRDFYNKFLHPQAKLDELRWSKTISRLAIGLCAIAGIWFSFRITDILDAIILFNYPYMGSLLIPLLAGVLWKGATRKGAIAAMFTGGAVGVLAFLSGLPGIQIAWIKPDLGLFFAYTVSLVVLIFVSKTDKSLKF
jgi:solute:Na+ symporter, SSS family